MLCVTTLQHARANTAAVGHDEEFHSAQIATGDFPERVGKLPIRRILVAASIGGVGGGSKSNHCKEAAPCQSLHGLNLCSRHRRALPFPTHGDGDALSMNVPMPR
jgi:hypothetical protein